MGTQSSGMNISYSSGSGRGTSGGVRGVRGASGKGAVKPTLKGKLATPKSGVQVIHNKQAMENAIKKANAPKGPSAMAVRAREMERKIAENNKRFGVGQSRPATKAEKDATTAKYKATTARTMSSDKVASNSVKVKPAARQKPGKKDIKTFIAKRAVRNEKINEAQKGDDFINSGIRPAGPFSDGKTKLLRQIKASNKKK